MTADCDKLHKHKTNQPLNQSKEEEKHLHFEMHLMVAQAPNQMRMSEALLLESFELRV